MLRPARRKPMPEGYDGSTALPNARWEAFCQNYTGEHRRNASASYRAAGYHAVGDRADTACALKLLANAFVRKRIDHLDAQALEAVRLTARDANERLAAIATASYADFLDEDGNVDIAKVRDPRLAPAVECCVPTYDREGGFTGFRLKLHDPMRAIELLGLAAKGETPQNVVQQVLVIRG